MRVLIYGMQSSGASTLAFLLAQRPGSCAFVDIWSMYAAPALSGPEDVVAKVVVTTSFPLSLHQQRFKPDKTILFLRHPVANYRSLTTKRYRNHDGFMEEKFAILDRVFSEKSTYDMIVYFEDLVLDPLNTLIEISKSGWSCDPNFLDFSRTPKDIVEFNESRLPFLKNRLEYGVGHFRGRGVDAAFADQASGSETDCQVSDWCPQVIAKYHDVSQLRQGKWLSSRVMRTGLEGPDQKLAVPGARLPSRSTAPASTLPAATNMGKRIQINARNIKQWLGQPPQYFDTILFDPNQDCNVHCAYCHNPRSKELVDTSDFEMFLEESVSAANYFQVGCAMEPTLDPRLTDLMLLISRSPARPRRAFRLQTNGILLHRHDHEKMRDAGLTTLSVSIDTVDPSVFKQLRGCTCLSQVQENVTEFHKAYPEITLVFVATVTSLNIKSIDELIGAGLDLGVTRFNFRQVFYHPSSRIVDHAQMPSLLVPEDEFLEMAAKVQTKYGHLAKFHAQGAQAMTQATVPLRADSLLPPVKRW